MARVTGPLFSMSASGTIGHTATFASWKGRQYVRRTVIPANPRSGTQVSVRAIMAFLATEWAGLEPEQQASWAAAAKAAAVSPFNAYVAFNARRWTQSEGPSQNSPPTVSSYAVTETASATGGVGQIVVSVTPTLAENGWGAILFRSTSSAFVAARGNAVAMFECEGGGVVNYNDTGLAPDVYYYKLWFFDLNGNLDKSHSTAFNATAT